jgi:hypothetical protein
VADVDLRLLRYFTAVSEEGGFSRAARRSGMTQPALSRAVRSLEAAVGVGIGVLPLTISSVDTAPFGMGLPPDCSKEGRARNRELNAVMQTQLLGRAQDMFAGILADLGCTDRPPFFMDAPVSEADVFLQLSVEELSYRRTDLPEHVHFIGRLPGDPGTGTRLPQWWADVLDADRVVVVTQGTLANLDLGQLIEPTLEATGGRAGPVGGIDRYGP